MLTNWRRRGVVFLYISLFSLASLFVQCGPQRDDFRVFPYLQNPTANEITLIWFSHSNSPGRLCYYPANASQDSVVILSMPILANELKYNEWEVETFFEGQQPEPPFRHRVRLTGLLPKTTYFYSVIQGSVTFESQFRTAPIDADSVRFIVFADCETEPESNGKYADWVDPETEEVRNYLIDQSLGFKNNLTVIKNRNPDFIIIAGDLVESGGEQRDWDEFWRHNSGPDLGLQIASEIPFFAAPGNHEYFGGPNSGGYSQPASENAIRKFQCYFEFPANHSPDIHQEGRYYHMDYGPVSIIALDVATNSPNGSENDSNFYLLGELDPEGGRAPAFGPGSRQYNWLENELQQAQLTSTFTFVVFHHVPYSSGPHGWPPGKGSGFDPQSGVPVRLLTPLFMQYGVDAVFAGHDEMLERSEVSGEEVKPDGRKRSHSVQFYDVGIAGDGLRGTEPGLVNPYKKFLAHTDSPEVWQDGVLVDGGKHYGHLEINVKIVQGEWQAMISPVYIFPILNSNGSYQGFERRVYDDIVTLINE